LLKSTIKDEKNYHFSLPNPCNNDKDEAGRKGTTLLLNLSCTNEVVNILDEVV